MTDHKYNPQKIESKWQAKWDSDGLYRSRVDWNKPKHYALTMLPYPSGDLHIGHWFAMTPSDARARYKRMQGFNVLFPMGFDAFGLPAENAAIQRGIHPATWTYNNIERMRKQLRSMGAMFDWEREIVSSDPDYYKWTEWFFKRFYDHDLAYRGEALVNWSPTLQTVLANEQVIDGKDERTGQPVIQKMMTQWFFRYTRYADEMLNYPSLDWPDHIRTMQTNWIGKSEGAHVTFHTEHGDPILIYTTRPDTLWGATFMVLAPEHPLIDTITSPEQRQAVTDYKTAVARFSELERASDSREKTGVWTGAYAINPVNQQRIPIWIADYVLITYGSGAIMAVPAHDERDFAFARHYHLTITPVIQPQGELFDGQTMTEAYTGPGVMINSDHFNGMISNGEKGRKNPAIAAVIDWLNSQGSGQEAVNYRLRDWLISRQRYWGSPIPMLYREDGTIEPVREDQLPVLLPQDVKMTGYGNPLAQHETFVNTFDRDENPARRETDTMDTFMCSSWYHLRYLSPNYDGGPFDPEEAAYWLPVDTYTGGSEHGTMHLMYTRWFNKAMRDSGMFEETLKIKAARGRHDSLDEPMIQLRNQGQILGEERKGDVIVASGRREGAKLFADHVEVVETLPAIDITDQVVMGEIMKRTENLLTVQGTDGHLHTVEVVDGASVIIPRIEGEANYHQLRQHLEIQRMSKSKGNVVNPDELVAQYGADTLRAYLMFAFDWSKGGPWDSEGIKGVVRWLNNVWDIAQNSPTGAGQPEVERKIERRVHQTLHRVTQSLEDFSFNTAVSALMALKNEVYDAVRENSLSREAWRETMRMMLIMMAPITPHVSEELWEQLGFEYSVHLQSWPVYDADKAAEDIVTLVIQINGRVRDRVEVPAGIDEATAQQHALASEAVQRNMNGAPIRRVIFIGGQEPKLNIVI
ncbi:MAG: leucine--tRNA ligase [Anaerolineae bacterium]|jgi:leucyl-tRNA synthetase|nr:leucine--tRNA ligase [Anaerolineae bacterium]